MLNRFHPRLAAAALVLALGACATPEPAPVEIRQGVIDLV